MAERDINGNAKDHSIREFTSISNRLISSKDRVNELLDKNIGVKLEETPVGAVSPVVQLNESMSDLVNLLQANPYLIDLFVATK